MIPELRRMYDPLFDEVPVSVVRIVVATLPSSTPECASLVENSFSRGHATDCCGAIGFVERHCDIHTARFYLA